MSDEFVDPVALRDEAESLFARDVDGQLIRLVPAVAADFDRDITLTIDGQSVTVKKAVPATDSQGNPLRDVEGRAIPRSTTIYDAASQLFVKRLGDFNPIPILCHQDHLNPVAVCRVCAVEISKMKRGKIARERKLLPACQHRVEETMEVHTAESPDPEARRRVRSAVTMLVELLAGDHLQGRTPDEVLRSEPYNELARLAKRFGVGSSRFGAPAIDRARDQSSPMLQVDRAACVLCDRCVRGCDEVKHNLVIGRSGKGYATQISFDLNDPMGRSSCVSCGECMISCPTGAITLHESATSAREGDTAAVQDREVTSLSTSELKDIPLFSNIPYKFLEWNARSVTRRHVKRGEILCREGEPGSTAFVLVSGQYRVYLETPARYVRNQKSSAWQSFLGRVKTSLGIRDPTPGAHGAGMSTSRSIAGMTVDGDDVSVIRTADDLIIGEMTCMSHYPRSATIVAREGGTVLEIGRNVLYMLQRDPFARELLNTAYRSRALASQLREIGLFSSLSESQRAACTDFLRDRVELVHVDPGQVIFRQGDMADHFYLVRLGFVKVAQQYRGEEVVLDYRGPGSQFGEIGLLSKLSERIAANYPTGLPPGVRTATCSALDDVELVRIRGEDFRQLVERYPELLERVVHDAAALLQRNEATRQRLGNQLSSFLEQGLFDAQKLLVLDLERCTRCDECTKACADSHGGVTRLVREGLRFDKFLIASSCRSCLDPYCMVGCPVDAIHRRPLEAGSSGLEIVIEDWCIGCGQCAKNCPYGNINMQSLEELRPDPAHAGRMRPVVFRKATTCDLCRDIVGRDGLVSCVYACPHNAAFRMSGEELLEQVGGRQAP